MRPGVVQELPQSCPKRVGFEREEKNTAPMVNVTYALPFVKLNFTVQQGKSKKPDYNQNWDSMTGVGSWGPVLDLRA